MTIERICSREVDTCEPQESIQQAAQRMHARKVGTLVVVDSSQQPIGIVTDRDVATRAAVHGSDFLQMNVRDIMTSPPKALSTDASLEDVLALMRRQQCRRILVVDSDGKLTGLISIDDVLELLIDELQMIRVLLRAESPRSLASE